MLLSTTRKSLFLPEKDSWLVDQTYVMLRNVRMPWDSVPTTNSAYDYCGPRTLAPNPCTSPVKRWQGETPRENVRRRGCIREWKEGER